MDRFYYQKCMINQFRKSVAAVNPVKLIPENLKIENGKLHACHKVYDIVDKNIYLIGFGKAVLGMATQCEKILGNYLKQGVICGPKNIQQTFKNSEFSLKQNSVIQVFEGAENNLPDKNAEEGTNKIVSLVQKLDSAVDHLIVLISGGGSALLTKPKPGISLSEKMETVKLLMEAGADIKELNTVRKKLSLVKGGGLASILYPIKTTCFIISDVINDPIEIIASGPTVPSFDSKLSAYNILQKYELLNKVPSNVLGEVEKQPTELDIPLVNNQFPHVDNFIIGNNSKALSANKKCAEMFGFESVIISSEIRGNVHNVSEFYTKMIFEILNGINNKNLTLRKQYLLEDCSFDIDENVLKEMQSIIQKQSIPICVIGGGETTVKVTGSGKGGRNQELALITSQKVYNLKQKHPHLFVKYDATFLFAGTDGIDGPTDAAGAVGDSWIVDRAMKPKLNIDDFISNNDSYNFFSKIDDGVYSIKTGHTGTNVLAEDPKKHLLEGNLNAVLTVLNYMKFLSCLIVGFNGGVETHVAVTWN